MVIHLVNLKEIYTNIEVYADIDSELYFKELCSKYNYKYYYYEHSEYNQDIVIMVQTPEFEYHKSKQCYGCNSLLNEFCIPVYKGNMCPCINCLIKNMCEDPCDIANEFFWNYTNESLNIEKKNNECFN